MLIFHVQLSNTYSTNLVDIYGCFRPYHARPIMQPYSYHFRTECEAEDESSVQLLPQDSAQVAKELFEHSKPILRISMLHLDCGYNLQPPNQLWLEKNRLVISNFRKWYGPLRSGSYPCTAIAWVPRFVLPSTNYRPASCQYRKVQNGTDFTDEVQS